MQPNQKSVTIDAPMSDKDPSDAINAEIAAGWRLTHIVPVTGLSTANLAPVTSRLVLIFRRDDEPSPTTRKTAAKARTPSQPPDDAA